MINQNSRDVINRHFYVGFYNHFFSFLQMSFNVYITENEDIPAELQSNPWSAALSWNRLLLPSLDVFSKTEWLLTRRIQNHYFSMRIESQATKKTLQPRRHLRRLAMARVLQMKLNIERRLRERDRTMDFQQRPVRHERELSETSYRPFPRRRRFNN